MPYLEFCVFINSAKAGISPCEEEDDVFLTCEPHLFIKVVRLKFFLSPGPSHPLSSIPYPALLGKQAMLNKAPAAQQKTLNTSVSIPTSPCAQVLLQVLDSGNKHTLSSLHHWDVLYAFPPIPLVPQMLRRFPGGLPSNHWAASARLLYNVAFPAYSRIRELHQVLDCILKPIPWLFFFLDCMCGKNVKSIRHNSRAGDCQTRIQELLGKFSLEKEIGDSWKWLVLCKVFSPWWGSRGDCIEVFKLSFSR